ncbi:MAG TPA: hypothetical protein VIU11_18740 [Nakamurella sp.]
MTFGDGFRLVIGLFLTAGALWVLFSRLDPIWNGPPALMTALLVVIAVGLVLTASAFWPLGRPADLPTVTTRAPTPERGRGDVLRGIGRVVLAVLAVGIIVVLARLRP